MSTDFPLRSSRTDDDTIAAASIAPEDVDPGAVDAGDEETFDDDGVLYDEEVAPEYGILGFTLRELLIVGVWALSFIVSFFPLGWSPTVWAQGVAWILPIGVPTVAVFLLVLRRFSPDGIRRVGSLGIDQFASVAFSVAAVWWLQQVWRYVTVVVTTGLSAVVWVPWVELVLSVALVAMTVFAPIIPGIKEDFHGRLVTLAHRNANPVRPVIARPKPEPVSTDTPAAPPAADTAAATVAAATGPASESVPSAASHGDASGPQPTAGALDVELSGQQATDEVARLDLAGSMPLSAHASGGGTGTSEATTPDTGYTPGYARRSRAEEIVSDTASIEALVTLEPDPMTSPTSVLDEGDVSELSDVENTHPREEPPAAAQPFWILAPTERDVHDERGNPIFRIGPSAWALVIEDRGGAFVVRHDDGRIGYLHDISDITKG
ncbi:hypothetical protein [Microbacterium sp. XT11]|uniref:hypothetical protein n=1 Tax=Microbacterium sp. XT11 TaxID=367477 RepID=UPI000A66574C|nr:hypothetical protein [Microbacterium sp. XT11]